jgi:hypothetical protein
LERGFSVRFRLHVADAETGDESAFELECASVQEARERAKSAGYLVSSIEPLSAPPTSADDSATPVGPISSGRVKRVTEVKATCSACGNVWFYSPGDRAIEFGRKLKRVGAEIAATRTTRCPECGSKAIALDAVTHQVVTERQAGFWQTVREKHAAERERVQKKRAEQERDLTPEQIAVKRKRENLYVVILLLFLASSCLFCVLYRVLNPIPPDRASTRPFVRDPITPLPTASPEPREQILTGRSDGHAWNSASFSAKMDMCRDIARGAKRHDADYYYAGLNAFYASGEDSILRQQISEVAAILAVSNPG